MEDFAPKKKKRYLDFYMSIAQQVSQMSQAKRLKVGSILVKEGNIISFGWNGMPSGWDNNCEDNIFVLDEEVMGTNMTSLGYTQTDKGNWIKTKTKPEVIHSEANCLMKVTKSNQSSDGSTMFLTHAPCIDCAKQVYTAGIKKVYYRNSYRDTQGVDFLEKCGIEVINVSPGAPGEIK
jgi:dCMP deaminase